MSDDGILGGDRHALGDYMREIANLMGLRDWYLFLSSNDPEDDDAMACCEVAYGQKSATLCFHHSWPAWSMDELKATVVHELLHCHTEPMRWAVNNARDPLGFMLFGVVEGAFIDALEVAVDGVARAWAEHLPDPEILERKEAA